MPDPNPDLPVTPEPEAGPSTTMDRRELLAAGVALLEPVVAARAKSETSVEEELRQAAATLAVERQAAKRAGIPLTEDDLRSAPLPGQERRWSSRL